MSIFHAKMSMLGTFSIMPGTLKLKYNPDRAGQDLARIKRGPATPPLQNRKVHLV